MTRDEKLKIKYIGKEYTTNNGRKYIVQEYLGKSKILVKFEDGVEVVCNTSNTTTGHSCHPDDKKKPSCKVGDRFLSNLYGWATVTRYEGSKKVTVLFDSGEEVIEQLYAIKEGIFRPSKSVRVNSLESFVEKSVEIHGYNFDYSFVEYGPHSSYIKLICNRCGARCKQTIFNHLGGMDPCNSCYKLKMSVDGFNFRWKNAYKATINKGTVNLCCCAHGKVPMPSNIKSKAIPCNVCIDILNHYKEVKENLKKRIAEESHQYKLLERQKNKLEKQFKSVIKRSEKLFGVGTYSYKNFSGLSKEVEITHNSCGNIFTRCLSDHLRGNYGKGVGCPRCAAYGFNEGGLGNVYLLKSNDGLVKIGVTHQKVERRVAQIHKEKGNKIAGRIFEIIKIWNDLPGNLCISVEKYSHNSLKCLGYKQPDQIFDGYTECYMMDDISLAKNIIENYLLYC